jgi:spermidine synthase
MEALGRHILVEYYGCSEEKLNDVTHIEQGMVNAAKDAGATVINSTFHHFSPFGVSGVIVIQESHLAIHTWPEYGYASVDLYTCGDTVDPWAAFDLVSNVLESTHSSAMEMKRGVLKLLPNIEYEELEEMREDAEKIIPRFTRNVWFTERTENIALSLRHTGEILYKKQSPYQKVEVYNTIQYGNMLALDGMIMCTETDEHAYHEMIVHVPMLTHPDPRRVLIIGGGDGGAAREVLRHESVEDVVMVEIDQLVVEASRQHLPTISKALDDPKLTLKIEDGIKFVNNAPDDSYDLIIVDSTDPIGPAEGLFTAEFYQQCYRCLKDDGIMVTQSESPVANTKVFQEIYQCYDEIFGNGNVFCYLAFIPTYPSGMWSLSYSSKGDAHPLKGFDEEKSQAFAEAHNLNYYSAPMHKAAFVLPTFVKRLLGK